jgi:hypothetical protein
MRIIALLIAGTPFVASCHRTPEAPPARAPAPSPVTPAPLAGSIDGVVRLSGEMTPDKHSRIPGNLDLQALRTIVVGEGGMLANVYVAVKSGLGDRKFTPPKAPVVLDQVRLVYSPRVMGIMTGQILEVRNSDEVMHSIHFPLDVRPGG